jgi:hypothetical protein
VMMITSSKCRLYKDEFQCDRVDRDKWWHSNEMLKQQECTKGLYESQSWRRPEIHARSR